MAKEKCSISNGSKTHSQNTFVMRTVTPFDTWCSHPERPDTYIVPFHRPLNWLIYEMVVIKGKVLRCHPVDDILYLQVAPIADYSCKYKIGLARSKDGHKYMYIRNMSKRHGEKET